MPMAVNKALTWDFNTVSLQQYGQMTASDLHVDALSDPGTWSTGSAQPAMLQTCRQKITGQICS